MKASTCSILLRLVLFFLASVPAAHGAVESADLEEVQNFEADYLKSCACITISKDGRFLYASGEEGKVSVLKRDAETGRIVSGSWVEFPEFSANTTIRLSPDNSYAVTSSNGA